MIVIGLIFIKQVIQRRVETLSEAENFSFFMDHVSIETRFQAEAFS